MKRRKRWTVLLLLAIFLALTLPMAQPVLSLFQESRLASSRVVPATHLLVVAMDSRGRDDVGLPDTLILVDLQSGARTLIARDWSTSRVEPERNIVEKYLGLEECRPFCTIQGVFSFAGGELVNSAGEVAGLEAVRAVVQREYAAQSVALLVFDLNWAHSFLHKIGPVSVTVQQPVPVGGFMFQGEYQGIQRYIPAGEQILSGDDLFWFARARHGSSNEDRMARQQHLVGQLLSSKGVFELVEAASGARGRFSTDLRISEIVFRPWVYQPQ